MPGGAPLNYTFDKPEMFMKFSVRDVSSVDVCVGVPV